MILLTLLYYLIKITGNEKSPLKYDSLNLTMKRENHQWRKDVEYLSWEIDYRNIWLNPEKWSKNRLKLSIKRRLQILYIQSFQHFLREYVNRRKCTIVNICTEETYSTSN